MLQKYLKILALFLVLLFLTSCATTYSLYKKSIIFPNSVSAGFYTDEDKRITGYTVIFNWNLKP